MKVNHIIKRIRTSCGLEQKELGRLIGKSESTISSYESGRISISMETFIQSASVCEYEVLLKDKNNDETIIVN